MDQKVEKSDSISTVPTVSHPSVDFLKRIILGIIVLHIILFFIPGNLFDFPELINAGKLILNGDNPYTYIYPNNWHTDKFPPLFFYYFAFWIKIFGESIISIKIALNLPLLLSMRFLFLFVSREFSKYQAYLSVILYGLNPIMIFFLTYSTTDNVVVFFLLGALYYLSKKNHFGSAAFIALGFSFKIFPIFLFALILVYLTAVTFAGMRCSPNFSRILKKYVKIVGIYLLIIAGIALLLILPYWDIESSPFAFYLNTEQKSAGMSITNLLPFLTLSFGILGIDITIGMLIFAIFFIVIFLQLVIHPKKAGSFFSFMQNFNLILLFSMLITVSVNPRIFFWILPIQCIFVILEPKKQSHGRLSDEEISCMKKSSLIFIISSVILFIYALFIFFFRFNLNITQDADQFLLLNWSIYPGNRERTQEIGRFEVYFLLVYTFLVLGFILHQKSRALFWDSEIVKRQFIFGFFASISSLSLYFFFFIEFQAFYHEDLLAQFLILLVLMINVFLVVYYSSWVKIKYNRNTVRWKLVL